MTEKQLFAVNFGSLLGMKPLAVSGDGSASSKAKKEDVHAPPENISEVKKGAKVRWTTASGERETKTGGKD